ncbi:MAG: DUF2914 domain-containing protein [Elusimicrobia bacterium]|nr:DUF2914 domain-containing protein [Elusimicrobiota bacterium]MBD3411739.1 DUF2914 domain-containing protein [Elusimicrobiota bacterium]
MKKQCIMFLVCAMAGILAAQEMEKQSSSELTVAESVLCENVEDRTPVGEATTFPETIGKVYFFTAIEGATQPTQIKHVWYYQGNQMADVSLTIQYPRHRTWSYKTILPEWTGEWSVEVIDENATVLKKASFVIGEKQTTEAESETEE